MLHPSKETINQPTVSKRSWNMSRILSENTTPERTVRSLIHKLGYRFRIHKKNLPGSPDIVLKKYSSVIFVHGCFWHQHPGCKFAYKPASHISYWEPKLKRNIERDHENQIHLQELGWHVIIVWECELKELETLAQHLIRELSTSRLKQKTLSYKKGD